MRVMFHVYVSRITGPFFYEKSSISPLHLSEKAIFLPQTNTSHLILSVQKPNYWIDLKVRANCENLLRCRFASWVKVSQLKKKYGSKTTNHSQLAWPFELHMKQTRRNIACDWLIFSQTRCLAVSDRLILSSWFNIGSLKCHIYSLGIPKTKSRKKNFSIWKR